MNDSHSANDADTIVVTLDALLNVESKLKSLSELFIQTGKSNSLDAGEETRTISLGVGHILSECADSLGKVREKLDEDAVSGKIYCPSRDRRIDLDRIMTRT